MPRVMENIDRIARKIGRGVLFLEFHPKYDPEKDGFDKMFEQFDYKNCDARKKVMKWFGENNVRHEECFNIGHEGILSQPYNGEVFIDVPFDKNDPDYLKVEQFLENPDGSMKREGVRFYYLSLEVAMQNKHLDDPAYWEDF